MGADFERADDALELLLEFDEPDPIASPNTGRKKPDPSKTPSASASTAERTRTFPRNSDPVNPLNSPEQLPAGKKQAREGGDKSHDEEDEETSHPRTSLCNVRAGREVSHQSFGEAGAKDLLEETSNSHDNRSDDADADCSNEEDLVPLKQRLSKECLDMRYNVQEIGDEDAELNVRLPSRFVSYVARKGRVRRDHLDDRDMMEEANGQDKEADVRSLPGTRRNRTASVGGHGSLEETKGRASKRMRQNENVGIGWEDSVIGDDFAEGGLDCTQGRLPGYGRLHDSPLLSSLERPLIQEPDGQGCNISDIEPDHSEQDCPLERENFPPVTVLGYKIPGPAGALQSCLNSTSLRPKGLTHFEKYCGPGRLVRTPIAAAETMDFKEGPWLAAMEFLNDGNSTSDNHSSRSTIVTIKATKRHVPQVVAILNTAVRNGLGDLSVTLKDPTGIIGGTIHRNVITELEDGKLITPGAVVIMREVAVFSPTPFKHYLNITIKNVDKVFGKDTIAPRKRGNPSKDKDDSGIGGQDDRILEPRSNHGFRADNEGHESESAAPNCKSDGQRATDILYCDDRIQADASPGSGTTARKRLPVPTTVEDAIDSRDRAAVTATVGQPNDPTSEVASDASQDAIAKAAGWDFSEDVELLLADDFF